MFILNPTDSNGYMYGLRWKIGEVDTLKIAPSAKDINGNSFPSYAMTFEPEPYFRVRNVYPPNGATNVYATTNINLVFNSPVDTSIRSKIQISPSVSGSWYIYYYDSMGVSYSYSTGLSNNKTYTMTVNASAHDKYGNQLQGQFLSSFTTAPFRVDFTYPSDGATDVYPYNNIQVYFTAPIDTGTVRSSFKIFPAIAGIFSLYDGNSSFSFYPPSGFLFDTAYTITVDTTLHSRTGDKLFSPYTFSFSTASFRVSYTQPYDGAFNVYRYTSIQVSFSVPIDTGSVRGAFSIKDSTGANVGGNFSMYDGNSYFYFYPSNSPLAANETYTVTISTAMQSKNGKHLKSPYTFSFTTGN